jgi:hypothetical protein
MCILISLLIESVSDAHSCYIENVSVYTLDVIISSCLHIYVSLRMVLRGLKHAGGTEQIHSIDC